MLASFIYPIHYFFGNFLFKSLSRDMSNLDVSFFFPLIAPIFSPTLDTWSNWRSVLLFSFGLLFLLHSVFFVVVTS